MVDNYKVDIYVTETQSITFVNAGWRQKHANTYDLTSAALSTDGITKDHASQFRAHVTFQPSRELQITAGRTDTGFNGDVILQYDVSRDLSAGNLQVSSFQNNSVKQLNALPHAGDM